MKKPGWFGAMLSCMGMALSVQGAESTTSITPVSTRVNTSGGAQSPTELLDEVEVHSRRLSRMRDDVIQEENRFYALFNDVNKDDDFDVHCKYDAYTGTRIKQRTCKVAYYEKAQAEEAVALLNGDIVTPADLVAMARAPEARQKMLAVINATPELRRLILERDTLERKYEATRKARLKEHWLLIE